MEKVQTHQKKAGFSLLELIVVLIIIGIIMAYPLSSMKHQITHMHRFEGQMALFALANQMEQYHQIYATYREINTNYSHQNVVTNTDLLSEQWYVLHIQEAEKNRYLLTATLSTNHRDTDPLCAVMTLSYRGERGTQKLSPRACFQ